MGDQRHFRHWSPETDRTKRARLDPIPEEIDERIATTPPVYLRHPKKFKNFTVSSLLNPRYLAKLAATQATGILPSMYQEKDDYSSEICPKSDQTLENMKIRSG